MRRRAVMVAVFLGACLILYPHAATIWVSPNGHDKPDGGSSDKPYRSIAYAATKARSGDLILLTTGEFHEASQTVLNSGVSIAGAGCKGSVKSVVYAPVNWNFTNDGWNEEIGGYIIKLTGVNGCSIRGIEFRGNGCKANGAIYCDSTAGIVISEVNVYDFRMFGIHVQHSSKLQVYSAYIENSGYERPYQNDQDWGGSLGNIGLDKVTDAVFHDIVIATTGPHGYGFKIGAMERCVFYNLDFMLFPVQSWGGWGANNFDLEVFGGPAKECEFYGCSFDDELSLMGFGGKEYDTIPYSIHLHHNIIAAGVNVGVEWGTDNLVIDHNYFSGPWSAVHNWSDASLRLNRLTFCYNICDGVNGWTLGSAGKTDNLRIYNNTFYNQPGSEYNAVMTISEPRNPVNWSFVNNCMVAMQSALPAFLIRAYTSMPQPDLPRHLYVANNCYQGIAMMVSLQDGNGIDIPYDTAQFDFRYSANLDADPKLPIWQGDYIEGYLPPRGSPLIDNGDPAYALRITHPGKLDIGARQHDQAQWSAGFGSPNDICYLWAPKSHVRKPWFLDSVRVDLYTEQNDVDIRYTIDGSEPTAQSRLYSKPILIAKPAQIRARCFNQEWGSITTLRIDLDTGILGYPNMGQAGVWSTSSNYDDFHGPDKAFDDECYTWIGWAPAAGDQLPWLATDMRKAYKVKYIELYIAPGYWEEVNSTRRNFQIQASNDSTFSTYAVLAEQGADRIPVGGYFSALISDPAKYRFVRAAKTVPNEGFYISELRVLCDTLATR